MDLGSHPRLTIGLSKYGLDSQDLKPCGLVEAIDGENQGLPHKPYLRARLVFDITKPLIPGCFLLIEGNRVAWIYFRYEGIFKFCK